MLDMIIETLCFASFLKKNLHSSYQAVEPPIHPPDSIPSGSQLLVLTAVLHYNQSDVKNEHLNMHQHD